MLADNGDTALTKPALGGEYLGSLGKPGGEPLGEGVGDDLGVVGGEGLEVGLGLVGDDGELGLRAPDGVQILPRNCEDNLSLATHSTLRHLARF